MAIYTIEKCTVDITASIQLTHLSTRSRFTLITVE